MPVDPSYRDFVLEQLERAVPEVAHRAMFGGVGIYSQGLFFALIADDTLYFKVDDTNRPEYEEQGMRQFDALRYYEVPADALEDPEALRRWAEKAIAVAARKRGN